MKLQPFQPLGQLTPPSTAFFIFPTMTTQSSVVCFSVFDYRSMKEVMGNDTDTSTAGTSFGVDSRLTLTRSVRTTNASNTFCVTPISGSRKVYLLKVRLHRKSMPWICSGGEDEKEPACTNLATKGATLPNWRPRQLVFQLKDGWSRGPDLNRGPADYESAALPTELPRRTHRL